MSALRRPAAVAAIVFIGLVVAPLEAQLEVPTLRDTDYPIPPDAVFVATGGDDGNPGTEADPLRRVATAVERAPAGATVVIREGVYREALPILSRQLTLQPYPHEEVWLKGSVVVTDWTPDGERWRHDGWTPEFEWDSYDPGAFQPEYPHAGKPDMVFVDGLPLVQVGSPDEVVAGTFCVDPGADELYLGDDPAEHVVEVAAHEQALVVATPAADGSVVRGLGFLHYAGHRFQGMLQADGARATFENNTCAFGASKGITVYNSGAVVRGNTLLQNGQMGLGAWQADDLVVEGNRLAGNNLEQFVLHGAVAEASGAKLTVLRRLVVRDNVFEDNLATGFWMDISVHDATVIRNVCRGNASFGIFFEISANALIAGNVIVANGDGGIAVSNSSDVRVVNNTIVRNPGAITVFDDSRVNWDADEIALGITWVTAGVRVWNNVVSNGDGGAEALLFARDYNSDPLRDADEFFTTLDFDAYHREDAASPSVLVEWWRGTRRSDHGDLAAFRSDSGRETNGMALDGTVENPFFVDEASADLHLKPDSPARGAGTPLTGDAAAALGVAEGAPVDLGALQYLAPRAVPDGSAGANPLRVEKLAPGSEGLRIRWDNRCDAGRTNLLHGALAEVSALTPSGSTCGVTEPLEWDSPPVGDLWILLVSDNGARVESSWGRSGSGERAGAASGACGTLYLDPSAACD